MAARPAFVARLIGEAAQDRHLEAERLTHRTIELGDVGGSVFLRVETGQGAVDLESHEAVAGIPAHDDEAVLTPHRCRRRTKGPRCVDANSCKRPFSRESDAEI